MKVICIGSANMEILFSRDSLPRAMTGEDPLERFSGGKFNLTRYEYLWEEKLTEYIFWLEKKVGGRQSLTLLAPSGLRLSPGGGALAIALGLAGAGAEAKVITALADSPQDFFSAGIAAYLQRKGITLLSGFNRKVTPVTFIIWGLPEGDERSIVFAYKPPYYLRKNAIERALSDLRAQEGVTHVIAAGTRQLDELPFIADAFTIAHRQGATTCFNPNAALLVPDRKIRQALLRVLDVTSTLQVNEREAGIFLGKGRKKLRFPDDVRELARVTRVPLVIVTRNVHGAVAVMGDEYAETSAFPVSRLEDTSGGGDAFTVGVVFGDKPNLHCTLLERLQLGAFSAAGNISFPGGHAGIPKEEILLRYLRELRRQETQGAGTAQAGSTP